MNDIANTDLKWRQLCQLEEIPRLGARVVQTASGDIAVFRTNNDQVFALDDKCPHRGGPLSQGIVFAKQVACPLHEWVIHLDSGEARPPDKGCARRYPVKIEQGMVSIALTRPSRTG